MLSPSRPPFQKKRPKRKPKTLKRNDKTCMTGVLLKGSEALRQTQSPRKILFQYILFIYFVPLPGKAIDNLALTCSQIIRKSMPKVNLPIPSLHGPVYFDETRLDDAILLQVGILCVPF